MTKFQISRNLHGTPKGGAAGLARRAETWKPPESVQSGVAFLARIVRLLLWLVVATWLGRKLFALLGAPKRKEIHPAPLIPKLLHRDPWCGTHVSAEISYPLEQGGQVLHFCSAECRERYQASQRRAASG